jgi:hypothetical protein
MTIKKSARTQQVEPAQDYRGHLSPAVHEGAIDRYLEELSDRAAYAKPAAEARRIVDAATRSLTDALYESRRDGHS